ncbi:transglycosylase domain-containing protein [Pseudofrankia sp. DC12]|uniref:transglycosylase domain-containing protein n=1 Tax=Pseudofrankia sp. DC12 TaxID=683315 RepID=UPI000698A69F|nr:transglycosylase domain-containing protein [Pseudofrankia sp. DC12]
MLDLPLAPAPPPPPSSAVRAFGGRAAIISLAIALVVALLALPLVSGLGLFAKASADHYLDLPSVLATPPLPQNSQILAANGTVVATLHGAENRVVVDGDQIPTVMRHAIVAIEDARFYEHGGFDPKGVLRAALRNSQAGDVQQGGSTLTQQYVKNVLLQNATTPAERKAATDPSVSRKIQELRYASALEKILPKDEILTRYLNIAYFGDGAYGVGTAAEHYFNVNVKDLTLGQAALLAGLVQSPSRYDPTTNKAAATTRRNEVLDHMVTSKYISATQAAGAKQLPIMLNTTEGSALDSCSNSIAPFFCDYVRAELSNDPALGSTTEERQRRLYEGGLQIHTTLDLRTQEAAQNAVDTTIGRDSRAVAPIAVVQPGTGNILAMAENRNFGDDTAQNQTKINLVTDAVKGGGFEPGSAFKAFTMAAALEQGYGLSTQFYSPSCLNPDTWPEITSIFPKGRSDDPQDTCQQGYSNSSESESGLYDMRNGTWDSVNTYYIQLEAKVGVMNVAAMAERLGIPKTDMSSILGPTFGGLTLSQDTRIAPLDMANAYAVFADGGKYCTPRFVTSAIDSSKENVDIAPKPDCKQVISEGIADTVASVLAGVITNGTGSPNANIGRPAAGKTGTNDNYSSAWFVGFTPQMAAAVALGDPRGSKYNLAGLKADGKTWPEVFGGGLPALIFSRTLKTALQGTPVEPLPKADPTVAQGTKGGFQTDGAAAPPASPDVLIDPLTGQPITGPSGQPGTVTVTPLSPGQGGDTTGPRFPGQDNGNGNGNGH